MKNFDYENYSRVINNFISKNDLSRDCVIANVIKLMEDLNIRVGNESYKKENGSYGITTLLKKHLTGNKLNFIGKKGIKHSKTINNEKSMNFIIFSILCYGCFCSTACRKITSRSSARIR